MTGTQNWIVKSDPIWHGNCISIILKLLKLPPTPDKGEFVISVMGVESETQGRI